MRLAAMERVAYVGFTTGSFDLLIKAYLPDTDGLYRFLNEDLVEDRRSSPTPRPGTSCAPRSTLFEWEGENIGKEPLEGVADPAETRQSLQRRREKFRRSGIVSISQAEVTSSRFQVALEPVAMAMATRRS